MLLDDQMEKQKKYMLDGRPHNFLSDILYSFKINKCFLSLNTENEEMVINQHSNWGMQGRVFWSIFPARPRLLPVWESEVTKSLSAL
jgi:hypothetical protein